MVFQSKLWFKSVGVLYLLWSLFTLFALITSWHIDNDTERNYVIGMCIIFFIAGVVNIIIAFKYRLMISDDEIKMKLAFKKTKQMKIDEIDKVILFKHRSKARIISKDDVIIIDGRLRYFMTFLRILAQKVSRDKFVFYNKKRVH